MVPYCSRLSVALFNGEIPIFIWKVELFSFTDILCRKNRRPPRLQRLFYFVAIISENNAVVSKITSVLSAENVND